MSSSSEQLPFWKRKKVLIGAGILLLLLVILLIVLGRKPKTAPEETGVAEPTAPASLAESGTGGGNTSVGIGIVTKVGKERIYESDVRRELSQYPVLPGQDSRAIVVRKISADSTLLQEAADKGLITLDPAVFDSSNKDYDKRIQLVEQAKAALDALGSHITGTVLAIWFNNSEVGALGPEKSKQLAYEKLSAIHASVKNNTMTVQQAVAAIKNDTQLAVLDPVYQDNASFDFDIKGSERISLDPAFDDIIRTLPQGSVSDVYLGKPNGAEALYMFAVVTFRK